MQQSFYKAFFRHPDGSWTCVAPATLDHPKGRIQVTRGTHLTSGTTFMGVDLVDWLEKQHQRGRAGRAD